MKKTLVFLAVLMLCCVGVSAQTHTYKYLFTVNTDTGVKSKTFGDSYRVYVTFTNNKRLCYQSDQNGVRMSDIISRGEGYNEYHYESIANGILSYKSTEVNYAIYFGKKVPVGKPIIVYMNFSTDYERLNWIVGTYAHVYERVDNKQPDTPSTLW